MQDLAKQRLVQDLTAIKRAHAQHLKGIKVQDIADILLIADEELQREQDTMMKYFIAILLGQIFIAAYAIHIIYLPAIVTSLFGCGLVCGILLYEHIYFTKMD